jgi:FtsP/CotA-like multicopper oxidase with cupredoxin domain
MSDEQNIEKQAGEEDLAGPSRNDQESAVTRRDFLLKTMMVTSGLALSSMLPGFNFEEQAAEAAPACLASGQALIPIEEITRQNGMLQAVLKVLNENKSYLTASATAGAAPVCNTGQMRFFSGYSIANPSQRWPRTSGVPSAGPTLRTRVGDLVQITLLNQVDVSAFGNSIDAAEKGLGCDSATSVGPGGAGTNTYPGNPAFDITPDCFHGSSSANLHFHGTHVPPSGLGDNILIAVRPSPRVNGVPVVNEEYVKSSFDPLFTACSSGHVPQKWQDFPLTWQTKQQQLLQQYDATAPWQGGRGLPPAEQLWLKDQEAITEGRWAQYYIGAYPTCFRIPTWNGQPTSMGQAPGTHWYHAHKHGSTALNLANGMAGALIIEGDYDDKLKPFFTTQQVLVLQQFGTEVNLMRNPGAAVKADLVFVNGQSTPVLTMRTNEMQLWRLINACHQKGIALDKPTGIKWVQTAQDGVQFNPSNYNPLLTDAAFPIPANQAAPFGSLSPGNRMDLLVQAPSSAGTFPVKFKGVNLFTVNVIQDGSFPNPMPFPTQAQFPQMPGFLADINPANVTVRRDLHFASIGPAGAAGRGATPPFAPPSHTINGHKFEDGIVNQTMMLGATEEWTLYNDSPGAAHPFHIHINPFQVVEILNPKISATPVQLPTPWVWWDDFAIPPAAVPPGGTTQVSGYVKILTRFVDYTGMYVLHCHILGHEDRGMMQLVQVITNTTSVTHH